MSVVEETIRPDESAVGEVLPILPLKETVVFPDSMTPLAIGQERSIQLVDEAVANDSTIALVATRNADEEARGVDDIYEVGTAALIHKMIRVPDGTLRILVQGVRRVRLDRLVQTDPYLVGEFSELPDVEGPETEVEALARNVEALFSRIIGLVPYLPDELQLAAANAEDPSTLANLVATTMRLKTAEKQELLEEADIEARLRKLTVILNRELEVLELGTKIQSQVQSEMEHSQREYFLRQQLKAIQEELGEGDEQQAEIAELRGQIEEAHLPEEADRAARRELDRLSKLPPAAAEYGVIRGYLEWILSLPWNETTEDNLDLEHARSVLDEDHYDLEKVKDRIIEQLAVSKLKDDISGPILCFVGPPGVGKTSLGQSIARSLGRKFSRISVGGVRDEAEIRGHRRTYIGALPGTIIRALRDAGSKNPVFMKHPWPGMFRTLWEDDERYVENYFSKYRPETYFTGDGAKQDADGYFWLMGRIDDVINVAGHRLSTTEIESTLVEHEAVAEAATCGATDPERGQRIVCFVLLKSGYEPSDELSEELRQFVAEKIGKIARPAAVLFGEDLPKTRSGKIMRRLLKDIAEGHELGDTTTLRDAAVVEDLKDKADAALGRAD